MKYFHTNSYQAFQGVAITAGLLFVTAPFTYALTATGEGGSTDIKAVEGSLQIEVKSQDDDADALRTGTETKLNVKREDDGRVEIEFESEGKESGTVKLNSAGGIENAELRIKGRADDSAIEALSGIEFHISDDDDEDEDEDIAGDVDEADEVRTSDDFKVFVSHKIKDDTRIKAVDVKDSNVEVEYEVPAKLLGLITTTINARAKADMEGNVTVAYPWYHIFMKKTHSSASLQSAIARAIAGERKGEREGIASTTIQATIATSLGIPNIFEIIANTLKNVSVKSETEATTTVAQ